MTATWRKAVNWPRHPCRPFFVNRPAIRLKSPQKWTGGGCDVPGRRLAVLYVESPGVRRKGLADGRFWWDIPNVQTITIRSKGRAVIPDTQEGQVFAYVCEADGTRRLVPVAPVEPSPAKVRFEKRNGRTVGVIDRTITPEAIREALADFP